MAPSSPAAQVSSEAASRRCPSSKNGQSRKLRSGMRPHRCSKPLSRTAGEGGERSEPGEGVAAGSIAGHARAIMRAMPQEFARDLRRSSSDAEIRLWAHLRGRRLVGHRFRRQHPIGPFIVDFACTEHRLIVEADGSQHSENAADDRRTEWLVSQGWRVVRFWNNDILANTEGVLEAILAALRA